MLHTKFCLFTFWLPPLIRDWRKYHHMHPNIGYLRLQWFSPNLYDLYLVPACVGSSSFKTNAHWIEGKVIIPSKDIQFTQTKSRNHHERGHESFNPRSRNGISEGFVATNMWNYVKLWVFDGTIFIEPLYTSPNLLWGTNATRTYLHWVEYRGDWWGSLVSVWEIRYTHIYIINKENSQFGCISR